MIDDPHQKKIGVWLFLCVVVNSYKLTYKSCIILIQKLDVYRLITICHVVGADTCYVVLVTSTDMELTCRAK